MGTGLNHPLPRRGSGSEGGAGDRSAAAAATHPSGWPSPWLPGNIQKERSKRRYHSRVTSFIMFVKKMSAQKLDSRCRTRYSSLDSQGCLGDETGMF